MFVVVVALLTGAAATAFFLTRDDDPDPRQPSSSGSASLRDATFSQAGVPFTFSFPGRFAPGEPQAGILWVAGISPVDIIDVRRVDGREYSSQGMSQVYGATLRGQTDVSVRDEATRTVDDADAVVFTVTTRATVPLRSKLIYFAHAGSTWQLECQSQAENRTEVDAACELMLDTLSLS